MKNKFLISNVYNIFNTFRWKEKVWIEECLMEIEVEKIIISHCSRYITSAHLYFSQIPAS